MLSQFPTLFSLAQSNILNDHSDFDKTCLSLFTQFNHLIAEELIDYCRWSHAPIYEDHTIENWKCLLTINLVFFLKQQPNHSIKNKIHLFDNQSWNRSSQYLRSIVALNHALANLSVPEVGTHLLESGAALIDLQEYSPWLALPFTPQHYEFGIFLALLGLITNKNELKENVLRLARWQLNTLDASGLPLAGLFVREQDSDSMEHSYLGYLLFRITSIFCQDSQFSGYADKILDHLNMRMAQKPEPIPVLWLLIEKWLETFEVEASPYIPLSEHIHDSSTALVGYRTEAQFAICTLHGSQTGLGTLKFKDIEFISYGPQHLPLSDCQGYGIEGNALSDQGMRRSIIEWKRHSFSLSGCARMVDQPVASSCFGSYRGIWLEVCQEFKIPHFHLNTNFLGLEGWDSIAFSFFVKAQECEIKNHKVLLPCTLDGYEGEPQTICLRSHLKEVSLSCPAFNGKMQVIPLAGNESFWGANFLIAYHMDPSQSSYEWQITPHTN